MPWPAAQVSSGSSVRTCRTRLAALASLPAWEAAGLPDDSLDGPCGGRKTGAAAAPDRFLLAPAPGIGESLLLPAAAGRRSRQAASTRILRCVAAFSPSARSCRCCSAPLLHCCGFAARARRTSSTGRRQGTVWNFGLSGTSWSSGSFATGRSRSRCSGRRASKQSCPKRSWGQLCIGTIRRPVPRFCSTRRVGLRPSRVIRCKYPQRCRHACCSICTFQVGRSARHCCPLCGLSPEARNNCGHAGREHPPAASPVATTSAPRLTAARSAAAPRPPRASRPRPGDETGTQLIFMILGPAISRPPFAHAQTPARVVGSSTTEGANPLRVSALPEHSANCVVDFIQPIC